VRWLADECVAAPLVAFLRVGGHDVLYVAESAAGFSDADVIALALHEKRLLLTEDKDFGDLVFRRERSVPGVVLMRIGPENAALKAVRLTAAIERYGEELFGHYVVIESTVKNVFRADLGEAWRQEGASQDQQQGAQ
jgi:predicted nuclease of predicted toxin-antitoxin system